MIIFLKEVLLFKKPKKNYAELFSYYRDCLLCEKFPPGLLLPGSLLKRTKDVNDIFIALLFFRIG